MVNHNIRSEAHEHFLSYNEHIDNKPRRKCKYCSSMYLTTTATTNLFLHLLKHKDILPNFRNPYNSDDSDNDSNVSENKVEEKIDLTDESTFTQAEEPRPVKRQKTFHRKNKKQLLLTDSIKNANNSTLVKVMAETFAHLDLPFQLVERPEFITMMDHIKLTNCRLPTRFAMAIATTSVAQDIQKNVLVELALASRSSPVTIAVDGWTNVRHDKVTNVIALCNNSAYYIQSLVNTTQKNTATWMYERLDIILNKLLENGVVIVSIAADNENVNISLVELLQAKYPQLIHTPCAAHTLQLCVKKLLLLEKFEPLIKGLNDIIEIFDKKKLYQHSLRLVQMPFDDNTESSSSSRHKYYSLIRPCDTRWSSSFHAAQRLLLLQEYIKMVFLKHNINPSVPLTFWEDLASLVNVLEEFAISTDIIQRDDAVLFDVYQQFLKLSTLIKKCKSGSILYSVKDAAFNLLLTEYINHINEAAVICSALFSFDKTHMLTFNEISRQKAKDWLLEFGVIFIKRYEYSTEDSETIIKSRILTQLGSFVGKKDVFLSMEKKRESMMIDLKSLWNLYVDTAPELSHLALALLSVTASEASVERSFSAQDYIHTDKRNKLDDATVQSIMTIKFNGIAKKQKQKNSPPNTRDLNEFEIDEDLIAIFGKYDVEQEEGNADASESDEKLPAKSPDISANPHLSILAQPSAVSIISDDEVATPPPPSNSWTATKYNIGECVQLVIPARLLNNTFDESINLIPVIILERRYSNAKSDYEYSVGIKLYSIDAWYLSSQLLPHSLENFDHKLIFGIKEDLPLSQAIINAWGYTNRSKTYKYVNLQDAYAMFAFAKNYDGKPRRTTSKSEKASLLASKRRR